MKAIKAMNSITGKFYAKGKFDADIFGAENIFEETQAAFLKMVWENVTIISVEILHDGRKKEKKNLRLSKSLHYDDCASAACDELPDLGDNLDDDQRMYPAEVMD